MLNKNLMTAAVLALGISVFNAGVSAEGNAQSIVTEAAQQLSICNLDDVRTNITLPSEIKIDDDTIVAVKWVSSNPSVITDTDIPIEDIGIDEYTVIPAGVVTRQDEDTTVTLTATLEYDRERYTKTFEANVKAEPEEDPKLEAYIFSFFESNHNEKVYFAAGEDPLHFTDLNGGQPVLVSDVGNKGIRDPYFIRTPQGDKFYLIATDLRAEVQGFGDEATLTGSLKMVVWESTDLVNWSDARLVDVGAQAYIDATGYHLGCVYAPEAVYDEVTGEYVLFWASRWYPYWLSSGETNKTGRKYKIFYSRTRDFVNFTQAELYMDYNGDGVGAIDTSMIKSDDGKYYRVTADGDMTIQNADFILGNWKKVSDITTLHTKMNGYDNYAATHKNNSGETLELTGGLIEGPEFFKFNDEQRWGLYADNYQLPGFGYIPMTTTDLSDTTGTAWKLYGRDEYDFGNLKKRHGSVMGITKDEYNRLLDVYGK